MLLALTFPIHFALIAMERFALKLQEHYPARAARLGA
jgi:hypothetical protein